MQYAKHSTNCIQTEIISPLKAATTRVQNGDQMVSVQCRLQD